MASEREDLGANPSGFSPGDRLDSWKEIAAYLKCSERTAHRWEAEGLPVHRHLHKKKPGIYAYKAEIDAWWRDGHDRLTQIEDPLQARLEGRVEQPSVSARSWRPWWPVASFGLAVLVMAVVRFTGGRGNILGTIPSGRIRPAAAVKPSSSGRAMLAVLPFQNLTGDPNQDYFIDGLTEEMITDLGRLNPGHLGVIARTSVMRYKNSREDIQQIGRLLRVDYVLEGAVRRQGNQVRITVQLIQVNDQTHLWAQSYDRQLRNILAVQDDVARNVADEIRVDVTSQQQAHLGAKVRSEAYEAYLKGRYVSNQRSCAKLKKGLQYFEAASDLEPNWVLAHVGVADSNLLIPMYCETPPGSFLARAKAATTRALEIDDTSAEAHASLGFLHRYEWNLEASAREFRQAIQLNPNCVTAHQWYAFYLSSQARHEDALAEIDRAIELDPLAPILSGAKALILFNAHRYQETIQLCHKGIDFDPNWPWFHFWLGAAYVEGGGTGEALQELRIAQRLEPERTMLLAGIGYADARFGKKDEALKILDELNKLSRQSPVSSFDFALLYAGLGEKGEALNWLERTAEERVSDHLYLINSLPWFADLRPDPKFISILRRIGLPPQP